MKFKWEHDMNDVGDINLKDLDNKAYPGDPEIVGWVQPHKEVDNAYEIRCMWIKEDGDEIEECAFPTRLQAMRALRTAYRMYVIGGGKQK